MKITQLYTYPIKSLRSVPLTTAVVSSHGFPYDRRFMLLKVHGGRPSPPRSKSHLNNGMENMTITFYPELALFLQSIDASSGTFAVMYSPPEEEKKSLHIPLEPDVAEMEPVEVILHGSPAKAYKTEERINAWFSSCFGYEVVLAYLGPNHRPVLGNISPNASSKDAAASKSWLSSIASNVPKLTSTTPMEKDGITFADVAAYLIVTEESLRDVSSRLQDGIEMDVTKFRPNIVLSGSAQAYEEDYWGGIAIHSNGSNPHQNEPNIELILTANCARCVSINVDYSTGKAGTGEAGKVLKKLMKDRRVDKGAKYSPIFGRYGFLKVGSAGQKISVGDEATISKVNKERTTFEWPGLG